MILLNDSIPIGNCFIICSFHTPFTCYIIPNLGIHNPCPSLLKENKNKPVSKAGFLNCLGANLFRLTE